MPTKTTYHHGDLKRALIDGAVELVREQGLQGWTLRGVARRVGVSHAAPYHHFADKEALLGAMTAVGFSELSEALVAATAGAGAGPLGRLRAMGHAYVAFGATNPGMYQVMFREVRSESEGSPEGREAGIGTMGLLVAEIAAAQERGDAAPGAPMVRLLPAWSTMHGFIELAVLGPLPGMGVLEGGFEAMVDDVIDAALRGLVAP